MPPHRFLLDPVVGRGMVLAASLCLGAPVHAFRAPPPPSPDAGTPPSPDAGTPPSPDIAASLRALAAQRARAAEMVASLRRINPDRARPIASMISRSFAIAERGLQRIQHTERRLGDRESAQREQLRQLAASVVERIRAQLDTLESALPTRP